jgi:drug/metabolite transporter (DMT)-like permease
MTATTIMTGTSDQMQTQSGRRSARRAGAAVALLAVTAVWGSTFVVLTDTVTRLPVLDLLGVRSALAALAVTLVAPRAVARLSWSQRRWGLALGLVYGLAQVLQTVLQLWAAALVCVLGAIPGGVQLPTSAQDIGAVLYLALVAGAVTMLAQTWAQARLTAERAAVIMTTEPVWAALFAVVLGGESLGPRMLVGSVLVLAAMYLVEAGPTSLVPAKLPRGRGRTAFPGDSSPQCCPGGDGVPAFD